jgi:hypothetical protein
MRVTPVGHYRLPRCVFLFVLCHRKTWHHRVLAVALARSPRLTDQTPTHIREQILENLTERCYYDEALASAFELEAWDADPETLGSHLEGFFGKFFEALADYESDFLDLVQFQKTFGLSVCSDRWTGKACSRVARCNGLPSDGHVIDDCFKGKLKHWFLGSEGDIQVEAVSSHCLLFVCVFLRYPGHPTVFPAREKLAREVQM